MSTVSVAAAGLKIAVAALPTTALLTKMMSMLLYATPPIVAAIRMSLLSSARMIVADALANVFSTSANSTSNGEWVGIPSTSMPVVA